MFSYNFVQKVNNATNIHDLVTRYVELVKSGKGYKGVCPFHEDSDPSFSVSLELNIAKCFSCGHGGSPINFLSEIENISVREATIRLAKEANIPLEADELGIDEKLIPLYELMEMTCKIYEGILTLTDEGKKALDYLIKRGISLEDIKKYKIGFASDTNTLINYLNLNNLSYDAAITLGLIHKNKKGDYCDTFSNRIIFPITDIEGNIISFSGRSIDPNDNVKYLNLINSSLFQKNNSLYNLSNIKKDEKIYLVEGFFDAISHSKAGFTNTIATMGVALTKNHIKILSKLTNHIVLVFDGDKTGKKTNIAQTSNLIKYFNYVDVIDLYDPQVMKNDPDSLYVKNPQAYPRIVSSKTIDGYSYLYNDLLENTNLADNNSVSQLIAKLSDLLENSNEFIAKKIADDLSVKIGQNVVFFVKRNQIKNNDEFVIRDTYPFEKPTTSFFVKNVKKYKNMIQSIENQILKGLINPQFGYNLYRYYAFETEENFVLCFDNIESQLYYLLKDYYKNNTFYNNDQVIIFASSQPQYNIHLDNLVNKIHFLNEQVNSVSYDTLVKKHDNYTSLIDCYSKLVELFTKLQEIEDNKKQNDKKITIVDVNDIHKKIKLINKQINFIKRKESK